MIEWFRSAIRRLVLRATHRTWNRVICRVLCRMQSENKITKWQLHELAARFDPTQDCSKIIYED